MIDSVVLPLVVGTVVGLVVGTLGGGGGILSVPILVYLLDQDPHRAATSALVIVGVTSLTALVPHARRGHVRWAEGLVFGLLGTIFAYLGSVLSLAVDEHLLMALFAVLLLVAALLMLHKSWLAWRARRNRAREAAADGDGGEQPQSTVDQAAGGSPILGRRPWRIDWARALTVVGWAAVVGLLTGFFGVGGGFAVVPALVLALRFGMRAAVGTSLLVIVINSAVGLGARLGEGVSVDWVLVAVFTAASVLAGTLGSRLSARARPDVLSTAFGILLALVSLTTAAQAFPALVQ